MLCAHIIKKKQIEPFVPFLHSPDFITKLGPIITYILIYLKYV